MVWTGGHPHPRAPLARGAFLRGALAGSLALPATIARAQSEGTRFPAFSWETVPCAIDVCRYDANFNAEEIAFLAGRFAYVSVEKGQALGAQPPGARFTETGVVAAARALKLAEPAVKVLCYWQLRFFVPQYAVSRSFDRRWGVPVAPGSPHLEFDFSNPSVRAWWLRAAVRLALLPGVDGLFIDQLDYGSTAVKRELLSQLRAALARRGIEPLIVGNGKPRAASDPASLAGLIDGIFYEPFDAALWADPDRLRADLLALRAVARTGKIVHFKGWPGFTFAEPVTLGASYVDEIATARRNIAFPLACFLAIAEPYSYFQYGWGYEELDGGFVLEPDRRTIDPRWYPELLRPLGPPHGEATLDGYVFRRSFAHADVVADLASHRATITWR